MALYGEDLFLEGVKALATVEANGIRVNVDYYKSVQRELIRQTEDLDNQIMESKAGQLWSSHFGNKMNLNSRTQLATVLFDLLCYDSRVKTKGGKDSASEDAIKLIDDPVVKLFIESQKLKKVASTYIQNMLEHTTPKGFLHPSFHLHLTTSFRSSCSDPNFQNMPIHDKQVGEIVRSGIIPRQGNCLVEVDYSAIEVRVAACYHKDPAMLDYIHDSTKDMHTDMTAECYMLPKSEITKELRYYGKNCFVFPQFYGSVYQQCAPALWEARKLKTANGKTVKEHLAEKGIKKLGACTFDKEPIRGTFEAHLREVSNHFWQERFPIYNAWKKTWYENYLKTGRFNSLSGFSYWGIFKRNEVINYPIQGSAFHCLLYSLILLQKQIQKKGLKAKIVGQIHDSIVADVPGEEVGIYLKMAKEIMTTTLLKRWPWIVVPLEIEAEVAPVNQPWFRKVPYAIC